jgi:hypothetical protein
VKIKKGAVLGRAQTTNTSNDCANAIFRRELRCGRAAFGWFHLRVFPLHLIYTSRPDYTLSGSGSGSPSAKSESQLRNISSGRPAAVVVFAALKIISPLCVVGPAATHTHETQHGQRWCPGGGQMNPLSLSLCCCCWRKQCGGRKSESTASTFQPHNASLFWGRKGCRRGLGNEDE